MTPLERLQARAGRLADDRAKTARWIETATAQLIRLAARLGKERQHLNTLDRSTAHVIESIRLLTRRAAREARAARAQGQPASPSPQEEEDLYVDEPDPEDEDDPAGAGDPGQDGTLTIPPDF